MYAKFVGTLIIMSFHASVWLHAARALLCSYGVASGHVGPKSFPGAAPRRLRFGHSSTNNRNGGQYGYTNAENHLQIICIRSAVQSVADAVLAVCKERKLTDAKLYASHWA